MVYLLIGLAGFIGAVLRYLVGLPFSSEEAVFPFGTLIANLAGSFILAYLTNILFKKWPIPANIQTALATGLIGSFTTFSTLSVEMVTLLQHNKTLLAFIYFVISLFGGLWMSRLGFCKRIEVKKA
ncbi:CrcB protein [Gracilibacillus ureilyticus]|uniref:Fluoride-specific ion channel FluC n=1 Tax=Gracilibacillus ureilyticus TaxID=531814 RepID=A0A1H9ND64_9BACI|nr:CrcB family protein [Gracilibacillus ureilyticus]SER33645.1 CrcB protein [Gracilibacillus ureilyticus]